MNWILLYTAVTSKRSCSAIRVTIISKQTIPINGIHAFISVRVAEIFTYLVYVFV